jgi:hypothetical protein
VFQTEEQKEYADRTSQGGFGGFEARNDKVLKAIKLEKMLEKIAEACSR